MCPPNENEMPPTEDFLATALCLSKYHYENNNIHRRGADFAINLNK